MNREERRVNSAMEEGRGKGLHGCCFVGLTVFLFVAFFFIACNQASENANWSNLYHGVQLPFKWLYLDNRPTLNTNTKSVV